VKGTRYSKAINSLYREWEFNRSGICTYCGAPSDTVDHVPCRSAVDRMGKEAFPALLKVDSCAECNYTLTDKWLTNLSDRASYLLGKYKSKYSVALRAPSWTDDEIESLGRNLRSSVEALQELKTLTQARLKFLQDVVENTA